MATLTIKPTAAGNDVQIKSGDGNTTHATFGDTSTVNMSAGTISGGTIASAVTGTLGSGITFPAGHVVRTTYSKENIASGHTSTSSTSEVATGLILTTPPTTGSNYNIITMSFNGYTYANQKNEIFLYCNKNGAGYSKVTGGSTSAGMHHYYNSHRRMNCMWIDNQAGLTAGNNLYQIYIKTDTGTFYLIHMGYDWHWMVQEVQA
jgi:hypothetical protein